MKNKPLVYTVFVLAASLLVAIFYQTPLAYGHSGDVLSAWASVTPTIDGVLSAGEWDDAAMQTFTTTGEIQGILYVKNDANNIYLAVRITDSTLSQDTTINDKVWLYFDNDHDGLGPEVGDDIIGWIGYLSEGFRDGYSDGTYVWWRDTDDGGTSDGLAAATGDETYNYFEISHPLDTTDNTHDFSLSLEDTVGFAIRLTIDGYDKGWWPSDNVSEWADIVVASAVLAQPIPDIKANGFDEPITPGPDEAVSVTVSLNPGEYEGENADWWLAAVTPFGIYFLTSEGWTTDWVPVYQRSLFSLDSFEVFNTPLSGFPEGTYTLYFGVDTVMDGKITWDRGYYDSVVVNLTDVSHIPLSEIPLEFHRRAAQLLEEMRDSGMAPGWKTAQLGNFVYPFYRPDVEDIAYYEFEVDPTGFIIISTGNHDYPITHWSPTGVPISQELERKALESDKQTVKLFKLDALCYVAEDGQGELVATVGNLPVKVSRMDPEWLNLEEIPLTEVIVQPEVETESDDQAQDITYQVQVTGPESSPIQFDEWGSWLELKAGYVESYKVLIESLRRDASEDWETEIMAKEFGEGLLVGETYRLVLLYPRAEFEVSGEGTEFASVDLLEREGLPPVLEITAVDSPPEGMADLGVSITYPNDLGETIKFVILDPSIVESSEEKATGSQSFAAAASSSKWSPWTIYWAGSGADQRLYWQYEFSSCIGSWCLDCASGCGATAWAMLFGWADHQAWIGNSYWKKRNGLYLQNGGKWPAPDADAPRKQDKGIENITKEIRNYIGSWCFHLTGQSATEPWNMYKAYKYFIGRTGTGLKTDYNSVGYPWYWLREKARNSIRDRKTPAIIGTGWLAHYPLAWAYAWRSRTVVTFLKWKVKKYQRWFYVNQGQGSEKSEWVSADTWFVGEIYPVCIPGTWCWSP